MNLIKISLIPLLIAVLFLTACGSAMPTQTDGRLPVVATTSIVADVLQQVGGDHVQVNILLPLGTDPHAFEPRPQDAAALADAQIVFANGAGLEEFLQPLLESAGAIDKLVEVSAGIELLPFVDAEHPANGAAATAGDPHTWMDPNNVLIWVENITAALTSANPMHAADYHANADAYSASLRDLDAWIRSEVENVPMENRNLLTDHAVLGYFAKEYGFTQVGTITGSFSTNAAPSAQELARLEDDIHRYEVKAVFVGQTANPALADQLAQDTGIQVVVIYHASLTNTSGPASTYLEFMRYNVSAIVEALK